MTDKLSDIFKEGKPLTRKQLAARGAGDIEALLAAGEIVKVSKDGYAMPAMAGMAAGLFRDSGRGYGFVTPDAGGDDVFIPPDARAGAWDRDRVLFTSQPSARGEEGEVRRILSHGFDTLDGRLTMGRNGMYVEPSNDKLPHIEVKPVPGMKLKDGQLVAVRVISRGEGRRASRGMVERAFGEEGTREAAVRAVLYKNGIPERFPPEVLDAAGKLSAGDDISGRTDLRSETIFTIDGASAKDLDDAVSLERDEQGRYLLGVHIADVTHYVNQDDDIDREALARGTSVYFADRVVPMLPEALSNDLCSLNAGQDKLTMSAFMTIDAQGRTVDARFEKSVIRSCARMTYDGANALLEGIGDEVKYKQVLPALREMKELAAVLFKRRMSLGSLDIETTESYIECDEKGAPVAISPRPRGVCENIIEEFMVCANCAVAEHMFWSEYPAVYRIHEKPDPVKLDAFKKYAALLGFPAGKEGSDAFMLRGIMDRAKGSPLEKSLSSAMLRSMMKARYSAQDQGHFGLAAPHYCHFTSPIRRYPDLMTHRLLKKLMAGRPAAQNDELIAAQAATSSSDREIKADATEREIDKIYMAEYMRGHIGETFDGVISGVQAFGLFVELENTVEGLVPVGTLPGYYKYDEEAMTLRSESVSYSPGKRVRVVCTGVNIPAGRIDFELEGTNKAEKPVREG